MFLFAIIAPESARNNLVLRLRRFLSRPLAEKSRSIYARWRRVFPTAPFPVRLPFGAWFIGRDDPIGRTLTYDGFESQERAFVQRILRPGMTVLDIGAHSGLYTLLASRIVGKRGRVFAFEPSPREGRALRLNLAINFSRNVIVQRLALGSREATATLYVVNDFNTGCNSLRPPNTPQATSKITVRVTGLDTWLAEKKLGRVDFIKLDVEGAELSVIKGAPKMLSQHPRPIIMVEVEDIRTEPWGYAAIDIIKSLEDLDFFWFKPLEDGRLRPFSERTDEFIGNFVAIPAERCEAIIPELGRTC